MIQEHFKIFEKSNTNGPKMAKVELPASENLSTATMFGFSIIGNPEMPDSVQRLISIDL